MAVTDSFCPTGFHLAAKKELHDGAVIIFVEANAKSEKPTATKAVVSGKVFESPGDKKHPQIRVEYSVGTSFANRIIDLVLFDVVPPPSCEKDHEERPAYWIHRLYVQN